MILVTGATGFLGRNLIPALVGAGHKVRALVRPTSDVAFLKSLAVETITGDVTDADSVDRAMMDCRRVVHGGGLFRLWGSPDAFHRTNVEGTACVLEAAARHGVERFVHISTVAVIGQPEPGRVINESHPLNPLDAYQQSKRDGERVVQQYRAARGVPAIILRPGAFYGPWGHYAWNRLFFEDPFRGLRVKIHGGRRLTFPAFVPDVARAIIAAFTLGRPGEVYNVSGESIAHDEANRIISQLAGISSWRLNLPANLMLVVARVMTRLADFTGREPYYPLNLAPYVFLDWPVSSDKARAELGFVPTPFEEGARQTVAWYRQIGILKIGR
ncbi:MAG: NAD-dependent epimerase/dehydratase family protein [Chloroflexi bacterium]|nr:NAD-dependent epimerase/dehydratase family protein [Chloroflexota bacterium]